MTHNDIYNLGLLAASRLGINFLPYNLPQLCIQLFAIEIVERTLGLELGMKFWVGRLKREMTLGKSVRFSVYWEI